MSDSKAAQTSSSVVTTNTTSDSFNRTNNLVTNTSDSGNINLSLGLGDTGATSGFNLDAKSLSFVVIGVIVVIGLLKLKR
jgi:hypothetical protein